MKISNIYSYKKSKGNPVISYEFFPPKTDQGVTNLLEKTIPELRSSFQPDFCSVTYGAGGSTRNKTFDIVKNIYSNHNIPSMAHLTLVNQTKGEISRLLEEYKANGINNILALRGDPPVGIKEFPRIEEGFSYAYELVEMIKGMKDFSVGIAGFPEGHPENKYGKHSDWEHCKAKISAGSDFVITQLFFDNNDFFEFRDYLRSQGVTIPIIPGIITINSKSQIQKVVSMCGAKIPTSLMNKLEELDDDEAKVADFGIKFVTQQCEDLLKRGVPGLHFYTLNKSFPVNQILNNLQKKSLIGGENNNIPHKSISINSFNFFNIWKVLVVFIAIFIIFFYGEKF